MISDERLRSLADQLDSGMPDCTPEELRELFAEVEVGRKRVQHESLWALLDVYFKTEGILFDDDALEKFRVLKEDLELPEQVVTIIDEWDDKCLRWFKDDPAVPTYEANKFIHHIADAIGYPVPHEGGEGSC